MERQLFIGKRIMPIVFMCSSSRLIITCKKICQHVKVGESVDNTRSISSPYCVASLEWLSVGVVAFDVMPKYFIFT